MRCHSLFLSMHAPEGRQQMSDPQQAIRQARRLIEGFTVTDPTLWPILSEIDLVLSRADV